MRARWRQVLVAVGVLAWSVFASATDVTIHLNGSEEMSRSTMKYKCDAQGTKMGLPDGVFSVEYLNGSGNSLAVVPVSGNSVIFASVVSGSGARYAAGQYIWWEAGERGVTFSSDSIAGKMSSSCHRFLQ